jgi:hypothetical protein
MQRFDTLPNLQGGGGGEQWAVLSRYLCTQLVRCSFGGVEVSTQAIHIRVTLHQLHTPQ